MARRLFEKERDRAERVLTGTHAGTWDWDLTTDTFNYGENCARILGYGMVELNSSGNFHWSQIVHPDDWKEAEKRIRYHLEEKSPFIDIEFRQRHRDGRWIWVNARGSVSERAEDGTPLRLSGINVDISKRKGAERKLRRQNQRYEELNSQLNETVNALRKAKRQAEEASHAKSDFLAVMSHELRTPLNPILGFTQLLLEEIQDEELNNWLKLVLDAGERELRLIDRVLKYSRLDGNQVEVEIAPFEFSEVCKALVQQISVVKPELEFTYEHCEGLQVLSEFGFGLSRSPDGSRSHRQSTQQCCETIQR